MGEMADEQVIDDVDVVEEDPVEEKSVWAGTFKSPEELERAYMEIREYESRRNEEISHLRQVAERVEYLEEQLMAPQRQRDADTVKDMLIERVSSGDPNDLLEAMAFLAKSTTEQYIAPVLAPQQANLELMAKAANDMMMQKYGKEWINASDDVAAVITEKPYLTKNQNPSSISDLVENLETAYEFAQARRLVRNNSQASKDAAAAARAAKEAAQTMQGSASRSETLSAEQQAWERIKNAKTTIW